MFAVVVLASPFALGALALGACGGGKKSDTTPGHASPESPESGGATGGAAYGGRKATTKSPTVIPSASANPCAGK
ncbi:MAG TPA: hypothetical protein VGC42_24995 [Kofleriaceae bacterium]